MELRVMDVQLLRERVDRYGAPHTTYRVAFSDGREGRAFTKPGWAELSLVDDFRTQTILDDRRDAPHLHAFMEA